MITPIIERTSVAGLPLEPGADLRGANLSGRRIEFVSLRGAQLDGANLDGARLQFVDLTGASLMNASMRRTELWSVQARSACFAGVRADESHWHFVDLSRTDFSAARVGEALLRSCSMRRATFASADLSDAALAQCDCRDADFTDANLAGVDTLGSIFSGARLGSARGWTIAREAVVEVLRRELDNDPARARLFGAIAINRDWCWDEWAVMAEHDPAGLTVVTGILAKYPASGCLEALNAAIAKAKDAASPSAGQDPRAGLAAGDQRHRQ